MKNYFLLVLSLISLIGCGSPNNVKEPVLTKPGYGLNAPAIPIDVLYTAKSEPTWDEVLAGGQLNPIGKFTTAGVTGYQVDVNNALIETGVYASIPIDASARKMRIHTVGHAALSSKEFGKWSRWYQEDGNTQIFRLFTGEENVSNKRENAARIEAFIPSARWLPEAGVWREFSARFTVVKAGGCVAPHYCSIFQAKGNNVDHWSVMLRVDSKANLWFYPRRSPGKKNQNPIRISKNVTGKPFNMKVLDNGNDYKMFIDGKLVGEGQWPRTKEIGFRWGIYVGRSEVPKDIVVLVTGVVMK